LVDHFLDHSADVRPVYATQSGVHPQRLTHGHLVDQSVELRAVADLMLAGTCRAARHALAAQERVAGRDARVAGQYGERCRLSGTVHAQQTETLACKRNKSSALQRQVKCGCADFLYLKI